MTTLHYIQQECNCSSQDKMGWMCEPLFQYCCVRGCSWFSLVFSRYHIWEKTVLETCLKWKLKKDSKLPQNNARRQSNTIWGDGITFTQDFSYFRPTTLFYENEFVFFNYDFDWRKYIFTERGQGQKQTHLRHI